MDVTPLIPAGRQIIETYGDGRFRIANVLHPGSVLVFPARTLMWDVTEMAGVTSQSLGAVIDAAKMGEVDLLLIGCGARMAMVPGDLRAALRADGIVHEDPSLLVPFLERQRLVNKPVFDAMEKKYGA